MVDERTLRVNIEVDSSRAELQATRVELQNAQKALQGASRAQSGLNSNVSDSIRSLPRLRYALYDVSTSLAFTGAAMAGFSTIALKTAIDYERQFADVIRTTGVSGQAIGVLRDEFRQLNSVLPVTFQDLSAIGTLAGQLNIPSEDVAEFTEVVAKLGATTDISIEQAATALGRLDKLLGLGGDQFERLGSTILRVGVNSVATESQIVAITTQLAGVANQAGLTADELIGLSASLASVGIQPELARGTITRLFGQISRAVSAGGADLENFGRIAGVSGQEFASGWRDAPVDTLLDFFDGIREQGGDAEAALRALGITSVRDVPAILRLAQTADTILKPALADAADEFANGTALADQYGIIAETSAAKLQILTNNFQLLLEQLGQSGVAFKDLIDAASEVLRVLTEIAASPFGGFVVSTVTVVGLLGGAILLLAGLAVRGAAGVLALRTAMAEMGFAAAGSQLSVRNLTAAMLGMDAAAAKSSVGVGRLTTALRFANAAAVALLAAGIVESFSDMAREATGASANVDKLAESVLRIGESGNFDDSIFGGIGRSFGTSGLPGANIISGAFTSLKDDAEVARDAILALGDTTSAFFNQDFFVEGGNLGLSDFIGNAINPAREEIEKLDQALVAAFNADKATALKSYQAILDEVKASGGDTAAVVSQLNDFTELVAGTDMSVVFQEADAAAQAAAEGGFEAARERMATLVDEIFYAINAERDLSDGLATLGETLFGVGADAAFTSEQFQSVIATMIDQAGTAGNAAGVLQGFFNALIEGGFASASQLSYLTEVIAALKSEAGIAGQTIGTIPKINLAPLTQGFSQAAEAAASRGGRGGGLAGAAREAAREVRTLVDYGRDLASVFGRAFDLRFGVGNAQDATTLAILDIQEEAQASRDRIRDLRLELQSLKAEQDSLVADKRIKQYFLSVAEAYGDELRAGELRAEIGEIDADLAENRTDIKDAQKELTKEQEKASKTLKGNSKAAIENRQELQGLLQTYEDQLVALAESGLSQDELRVKAGELRDEFVKQATQLGYNKQDVDKLALSFGDMATIIGRVPRNVTVSASTSPAIQALREFEAQAAASGRTAGRNFNSGFRGAGSPRPVIPAAPWENWGRNAGSDFKKGFRQGFNGALLYSDGTGRFRGSPGDIKFVASGGYISGPGTGTSDSVPAMLSNGEYVVRASSVSSIGTGVLSYLNKYGQLPAYSSGGMVSSRASSGGGSSMPGSMMVELSPIDRKLLAAAGNVSLRLDGRVVAQATNRTNTVDALRGTN